MKAIQFSVLAFAPLLLLLIFPIPFIPLRALSAVLILLISVVSLGADPPLADAMFYCFWAFAPMTVTIVFLFLGTLCRHFFAERSSQWKLGISTWVLSSIWLFLLAAYLATMLFSVSMAVADGGLPVLIGPVAIASIGITVLGQILIIPWLYFVLRVFKPT